VAPPDLGLLGESICYSASCSMLNAQCSCGCGTPVGNVHRLLKPLWNRCDYFETSYRALLSPRCGPVPDRRNRDTRRPPSLLLLFSSSWLLAAGCSARPEEFAQERLLLYRVIVREEVGLRLENFSASHSHSYPGHRSDS
jgi:hypothetical protein